MKNIAKIVLKPGKEKNLLKKHPWIFSGALQRDPPRHTPGMVVSVFSATGEFLAYGNYSHESQIRIRIISDQLDHFPDEAFIDSKIQAAITLRKQLLNEPLPSAYRVISSEADGLPGLIVDHYDTWLVCQFLTAGMEFFREAIIASLSTHYPNHSIYERSDASSRQKEGLEAKIGVIKGETPSAPILITEGNAKYWVDLVDGHKTGFYLDQKTNREMIMALSQNKNVLNCFSYTGGFGIAAGLGGAKRVLNIDSSEPAVTLGEKNAKENQLNQVHFEKADVFAFLRRQTEAPLFDLIILDPPKFANSVSQINPAARGYKDINRLAMKALKPNSLLVTFSCSGHIEEDLFRKIIISASQEAEREVHFLRTLQQAPDHPVVSFFPESHYLKGFLLYVR